MSTADATDIVTIACPDCGEEITGKARGVGSAAFKLGGHRSNKHGYKNPNKPRRPTAKEKAADGAPGDGEGSKPTLLRVVEAATAEINDRSSSKPTVDELSRAGARLFGALSVGLASYAAETDPTVLTEEDREAIVDHLSLHPEEARDIAYPLARAMGRSSLNAKYGRGIVDNVDVVSAVTELAMVGVRWRRYFRMREQMMTLGAGAGGRPPDGFTRVAVVPPPMSMGHVVDVVPAADGDDHNATAAAFRPGAAGPMAGVVVTPEMVQQIMARRG